ncbi:aminodeoxychorismate lyase [Halomonas campisalis]|uniref:Aminodeoxychorismate lyase n=1 Tax=Billgrantia campisalis TaxID=74661 RepID=A0ABS9P7W7_9GAMM|nr:aminodeoxychorismate lyase [Halomonas campisalis]MCG6657852.1 aminodeoxychorismate lyase [Halomonas campisalis]MDR5863624.1 aminodeoxychorismate lyase [Halomonas campisalis]
MSESRLPEEGAVPLDDRGLAYGDGLFETVLVRDGEALLWEAHLARLARGCRALGLPMPARDRLDSLPGQAGEGLRVLKLILTRGSGGRGYLPPAEPSPRLRWQAAPFSPQPHRWRAGVRVRLCRLRLGLQPALAGLKHLNRLENVLARQEWQDPEVAEGLLCDSDGWLVEATCMNLFWRRDGRLETPRLDRCGVAGTLRAALLEALPIAEVDAGPEVLLDAEAAWLGNSLQGVWPLARLDDARGSELKRWAPGEAHRSLQAEAHRLLGYSPSMAS